MRRKIQKYLSGEREGFSLIELIIVIAIMAILIGVVALVVLPYLNSSRESTDRAALNEVATAFKSTVSGSEKFATELKNGDDKTITQLSTTMQAKINSYLEKKVTDISLSSDACDGGEFHFVKDATKGFYVYIKVSGKTAVDSNGDEFTSLPTNKATTE